MDKFGDSLTDWGREFQRMGEAREKSWRRIWEEVMRELESRRSWEEWRGRLGWYFETRLVM